MQRDCSHCGTPFTSHQPSAAYCSPKCGQRARSRRHYVRHPDQLREKRRRDNSDTATRIIYRARHRAKKLGIPFDITAADFSVPYVCPVLGITLREHRDGRGQVGYRPDAPSLDRIIPALGYVKGNVHVISARANLLKSDATAEELDAVLAYVREKSRG